MKIGEVYFNNIETIKRVKVVRVGPCSFTVQVITKTSNKTMLEKYPPFQKTFSNKAGKEAFLTHWTLIPAILLELE